MNNRSTSRQQSSPTPHILLLGASGVSGIAFINYHLSLPDSPSKPYLTLYIRPSARSKLPSAVLSSTADPSSSTRIRIVEGDLTDSSALRRALSSSSSTSTDATTISSSSSTSPCGTTGSFPAVTAVISLLGAYVSLYDFLTRYKPTPISDAFRSTVIPAIRDAGVKRVLVLSTPTAYPVPGESERMSWGWWMHNLLPTIMVPQGSAEMKGLAEAVTGKSGEGLDVTVFRVPFMSEGETGRGIVAGFLGHEGFTETKTLARGEMVKWLLQEIEEPNWIGKAPAICDK